MGKNKNQKNGLSAEKVKNGLDTAIEVTIKTGKFIAAAAAVVTAVKSLKDNK